MPQPQPPHPAPARPAQRGATGALGCLLLLVAWLAWLPVPPAAAHASLVSSDPAEAGLLETLPSRAVLTFDSAITEVHALAVTGPDGDVVNGAATYDGAEVRQNLWAGPDGDYVMSYDVVAADGHEISGEVRFEVGPLPVPAGGAGAASGAAATEESRTWERPGFLLVPAGLTLAAVASVAVLARRRRSAGTRG
ncbi:copper resistance CopC family protein [Nocardioides sp. zg-DK7169]|uniref:copper resistance CopC family protein n=1 Tax=Nocardioides sp. zg-DK7169 TaxID=2736600 RepID=UPI0015579B7E|nr:copper resistance CopC family protein [Nocardioides sp. zg-DK7169]NPC96206.1 copper resistance protein CopC [Nocardioides sp. zg-DK7169]